MKRVFMKPWFIGGALLVIIAGGYFVFSGSPEPIYDTVTVTRGTIEEIVSVTGTIVPHDEVNLAFERSGRVTEVNGKVGDRVEAGKTLVTLARGDLRARLLQAEANLDAENAKLLELKQGTRPEDIAVTREKIKGAEASIEDASHGLVQTIQDSYAKVDDAIRNKVDQFFDGPRAQSPQILFLITDNQFETDLEWGRVLMEKALNFWKVALESASSSEIDSLLITSKENLNQAKSFLAKAALAVNTAKTTTNASQTKIDGWRSDVASGRANVNAAMTSVLSAEEKYRSARSSLALLERELALKEAGVAPEAIKGQEARVKAAAASVADYTAQLRDSSIVAPIGGTITQMEAKLGSSVSAGTTIVSLISTGEFEIEINIPEADIASVKKGDEAQVTLDAYSSDVIFRARVVFIDPAATVIEGVPTYKTTLALQNQDERIKSGMTANVDITSEKRDNVLQVPEKAVRREGGKASVRILRNNEVQEREVSAGLRGSLGMIEIIEGLEEGEQVIVGTRSQ